MAYRFKSAIPSSEITQQSAYLRRREFVAGGLAFGMATSLGGPVHAASLRFEKSRYSTDERQTSLKDIASYNNFNEFGDRKTDPAENSARLTTNPWTVAIDGLVAKPARYQIEDILKQTTLEERIYRLRCVEAWSMVVPWIGFQLADVLKRAEPLGSANFVAFEALHRPEEMSGQRSLISSFNWPYVEGLRLDEAMHPLTILAVGLYGETLPNQNGAPLRLVVPWKYGFKSIKSIVRISLVESQPKTTWNRISPREYGFFSNVNPGVDHPRWSQASERRVGDGGIFAKRRATLMFNGYAEEVANLYAGMDLEKNY